MIIAVTGTPGTGKDAVSKIVGEKLGFDLIDLNKVAKEEGFFLEYDKKRKCDVADIKKLNSEIKKIKQDSVIQSHYSHELDADLVIVLRTSPGELRKRLEKRGWFKGKIEENIEAEIMEVCKSDALEKNEKVFEVDTTEKKPEESAEEVLNIIFREAFEIKKDLELPEKLLEVFRKPYGKLFSSAENFVNSGVEKKEGGLIIVIGDQSSHALLEAGLDPDIIVIDGKVRRQAFEKKIVFGGKELKVYNKAGITSKALWNSVKDAITSRQKTKILVNGEDDLAVLPSVIMSPLGSIVLYGQPELSFDNKKIVGGLVCIEIGLEKKKDALRLLREMERLQV